MKSPGVSGREPRQHPGAGGEVEPSEDGEEDGGGEDEHLAGVRQDGDYQHHCADDQTYYGDADSP